MCREWYWRENCGVRDWGLGICQSKTITTSCIFVSFVVERRWREREISRPPWNVQTCNKNSNSFFSIRSPPPSFPIICTTKGHPIGVVHKWQEKYSIGGKNGENAAEQRLSYEEMRR